MKPKRFGAPTMMGAVALAAVAMQSNGQLVDMAGTTDEIGTADTRSVAGITHSASLYAPDSGYRTAAETVTAAAGVHAVVEPAAMTAPSAFDLRSADFATSHTRESGVSAAGIRESGITGSGIEELGIRDFGAWPAVERNARLVAGSCSLAPFTSNTPFPGIAAIGDPAEVDCVPLDIDTLRYSIPGPIRGIDPGPPLQI